MLPRSRPLRFVIITVIVLISIALVWYVLKPQNTTPEYITAAVVTGNIEDNVLASGTLQAAQQVSVGAQVSGQVKKLSVKLGDDVKKGQLIAQIDSTTQQITLKNNQAAVANLEAQKLVNQANLELAQVQADRMKVLLHDQAVSKTEADTATSTLKVSKANIAAIDAQIEQAQLQVNNAQEYLGYTRITAPMDGTVVAIVTEQGQTVNANQTAPTIIKLAKLDTLTVRAQISEADVVKVKSGQTVYFTILGNPDKRYYAKLRSIEPAPESIATDTTTSSSSTTAVYYIGLFDVPNPDGELRIKMTAQVYIVVADAKNALLIPSAALEKAADGTQSVRILDATGQAQKRTVKIGLNNRVNAQVLSGLKAGEKVIIGNASDTTDAKKAKRDREM
ncbi:macrolide transporter subunit MacA [Aquirhabdus parva]|uniref:Macrolide transporter subunit MacA n=1 Tax=Aquirhabdus parva TaxID=2283318 RepID=A0A345P609_9GAMM|nr:macrolide transporter subunit MacA [Aquirhabdus parva]AXI02718.1 macrolide transporter subunit MacA [Aquirhabdus parva]